MKHKNTGEKSVLPEGVAFIDGNEESQRIAIDPMDQAVSTRETAAME